MIIHSSRTGNVRAVVSKLTDIKCVDISTIDIATEPYFIFTYTDKIGEVPEQVMAFLNNNHSSLRGVIASGNVNFGNAFCLSADIISRKYNVPIIRKLDLRGNKKDLEIIQKAYADLIDKEG